MSTKKIGDRGEESACEYLVDNKYNILCKNWRISFGEIDIIAKKKGLFSDKTIHFIEVKALSAKSRQGFYPEQHVDFRKQKKLKKLAEIWLLKNKYPENTPYQIDIVAVSPEGIKFFENAIPE